MKLFGERLKKQREMKKSQNPQWTQQYVAKLIGVARPTYTAYENGTKEPPFDTLNKIADIFDVSIDYLQGRTNELSARNEKNNINKDDLAVLEEFQKLNNEDKEYIIGLIKRIQKK